MKRLSILLMALAAVSTLQAQWIDDPMTNTYIANCENAAAEIRVATTLDGRTFVQWLSMSQNGWSPKLQYLNSKGVPQWGPDGVHITTDNLATWSPGYAIAATTDSAVISMFRTADARHWVVKVNADGSTPWGTGGFPLFDGEGGGRSELLAGDDGGFWALGTDMDRSFLCYVNADGTCEPMATISDPTKKCSNGVLIPSTDGVFVVYSKHTLQGYTNYNKEIYVAKYNRNGEQVIPETLLFGLQTVGASYIHYAIPDGLGGGYAFQWHAGIGGVYNTYVTHFDADGNPTISDPNGIPVHSADQSSFYLNAYPTIDPVSHDLLLVYRQTDSYSQSLYKININRITLDGAKPWGDGIIVLDNGTSHLYDLRIDAFESGDGFSVIYQKEIPNAYAQTIEAQGFDMDGNVIWSTQMCGNPYPKTGSENTSGFHNGQNIVTWVNSQDGGVYGQNIGWNGTMGYVLPPSPSTPCDPPTDFEGYGVYHYETYSTAAMLSWTAPEELPLHYNLYCEGLREIIEIDPESTSYYMEEIPYEETYFKLTAVYEDCESDFALTPLGDDYILIYEELSVPEIQNEEIVSSIRIYDIHGQLIQTNSPKELSRGVYILQGLNSEGKLVTRKTIVN